VQLVGRRNPLLAKIAGCWKLGPVARAKGPFLIDERCGIRFLVSFSDLLLIGAATAVRRF
jgi:hypothetical protein